jgi:glycosyltransferase involved in cell wall biosynthesis
MPDHPLGLLLEPETHAPALVRYRRMQKVWKTLPIPRSLRTGITAILYRLLGGVRSIAVLDQELAAEMSLLRRPPREIPPGRLIFSSYLGDTSGIGRAGRMSLRVLREAGFAPLVHNMREARQGWGQVEPGGVWFCHCNAMEGAELLFNSEDPRGCYRVGYWAWELPNLPPEWWEVAPLFHEIWAPSRFIAEAVQRSVRRDGPVVRYVPHPLPQVGHVRPDRVRYGLGDEVFAFLCMYDVHSSATRKNPMGAVKAFQAAFDPGRKDVVLLVKVTAAQDSKSCLDEVVAQTSGWPNIRIITDMLSDDDADRLLCSADAFVSLHRSEGFGLSIAQAMAMGRPVIVTGWSGNMDFCGEGARLVDYVLIPVSDPHGVYRQYEAPGQVWADPDLAGAARAMRELAADPAAARRLGERARRHVEAVLPRGYDLEPVRPWIV